MEAYNWSAIRGAAEKWREELRFAEQALEVATAAQSASQVVADAEIRKAEAEAGYRQAYAEKELTLAAIEGLKQSYAKLSADLVAAHDAEIETARKSVLDSNLAAAARIEELNAEVEKAESKAAQRIAAAEVAASEAEARVAKAEKALADLKGA